MGPKKMKLDAQHLKLLQRHIFKTHLDAVYNYRTMALYSLIVHSDNLDKSI